MFARNCSLSLVLIASAMFSNSLYAQAPDEGQMREMMERMQEQMRSGGGMDEAQMKALMQQAETMQTCVKDIDTAALENMREESEGMMSELKAMCAAGKREQAQAKAMAFGQRVAKTPEMKKMRKCGAGMKGMLPAMAAMSAKLPDKDDVSHVCDGM